MGRARLTLPLPCPLGDGLGLTATPKFSKQPRLKAEVPRGTQGAKPDPPRGAPRVDAAKLAQLEAMLFGSEDKEASLPLPDAIAALLK